MKTATAQIFFQEQLKKGTLSNLLCKNDLQVAVGGQESLLMVRFDRTIENISTQRISNSFTYNSMLWDPSSSNHLFFNKDDDILFGGYNQNKVSVVGCTNIETKKTSSVEVDLEIVVSIGALVNRPNEVVLCSNEGHIKMLDMRQKKLQDLHFLNINLYDLKCNPFNEFEVACGAENNHFYIFDIRNGKGATKGYPGHSKEIFSIDWHPNKKGIIATSSLDKYIRVWNVLDDSNTQPLVEIKNQEGVQKIRWINSINSNTTQIASTSQINDKNLTIWDIGKSRDPQSIFKTPSKDQISDFVFSDSEAIFISKDNWFCIHSFSKSKRIMNESRQNVLACDLMDGYAWGIKSKVKQVQNDITIPLPHYYKTQMLYAPLANLKSCYDENQNTFQSLDQEILYFITNYRVDVNLHLDCLIENRAIAEKAGKHEIAGIWECLYDLVNQKPFANETDDLENENSVKTNYSQNEQFRLILRYYKINRDRFVYDIQSKKISIDKVGLCINSEYETELYDKIDEFNCVSKEKQKDLIFSKQKLKSTLEGIMQDLIDNGEFLHAYKMFCVLRNHIGLSLEKMKIWEYTYIDILMSMSFYNNSAKAIKDSQIDAIRAISTDDTRVYDNCGKCDRLCQINSQGMCPKCKDFTVYCSACSLPVKGLMIWCQVCSHGGHLKEVKEWFEIEGNTCPAGCGHKCFNFS